MIWSDQRNAIQLKVWILPTGAANAAQPKPTGLGAGSQPGPAQICHGQKPPKVSRLKCTGRLSSLCFCSQELCYCSQEPEVQEQLSEIYMHWHGHYWHAYWGKMASAECAALPLEPSSVSYAAAGIWHRACAGLLKTLQLLRGSSPVLNMRTWLARGIRSPSNRRWQVAPCCLRCG